jgi:hypothetical protein
LATRRRYRSKADRLAYSTGGSVSAGADAPPPPMTPPPVEPATPPPETHHAMARAIEAQRQAEALQRDPELAFARGIDSKFQNLSEHKRDFIKRAWREHGVNLTEPQNAQAMTRHYYAGLAQGIPDDSPEMNAHLNVLLEGRHNQWAEKGAAVMMEPPPTLEPSIERAAERLDHDAHAIHQALRVEDSTPLAVAANLPLPGPAPRRSSIPMAAPVSRDVPSPNGQRVSATGKITLSPTEREIAWNSFGQIKDASGNLVDLTKEQKERLYANNKARMLAMRADGTLNE